MIDRSTLKGIPFIFQSFKLYQYLTFQPKLALAQWRDRRNPRDAAGVPLPPAKLRFRVHGGLDVESFLRNGEAITADLRKLLRGIDRDFYSFRRVLDFGCGSGRVLRNLSDVPASCELHGTDIDSELIEWCRANLSWARFSINPPLPPSPYSDAHFDFLYAISVFTHLDENYQSSWLKELARIAQPGAILILTVHGKNGYRTLSPLEQKRVESEGFLFLAGATGKLKLDGLPDFYQNAYQTREYIDRAWPKELEVLQYVERGVNNHQDAVILRRR